MSPKLEMARAARINRRLAELDSERAELQSELARIFEFFAEGETVDLSKARRRPVEHLPALSPVSEVDRARARAALRDSDSRRRVGR